MASGVKPFDTIVIGAGIIGLAAACHLTRRGQRVLVLEKDFPGAGSSGRCIGGIRQQFSTEGSIRLMQESVRQFARMEEEFGFSVEYHTGGYLFLAHDRQRLEAFRSIMPLQKKLGLDVRLLSVDDILAIVPPLNAEGLFGGVYSPADGQAYPFKVLDGYCGEIRRQGSEIKMFTPVTAIVVERGKARGVRTAAGDTYEAEAVLNAAGPWAKDVAAMAGVEIPFYAEEHEALITTRLNRLFEPMIVDYRVDGCYFQQRANGQVIGCYTPNPNKPGIHTDASMEFLLEMSRRTVRLIPALAQARVIRHWGGCYEMTPDGSPIVDATAIKGFYVAIGMCGHGFMFGPAMGKFIAQIMLEGTYPYDWSEFKIGRDFSRLELMK